MDPKKVSSLDPKLKEAYERIMGTSNSSAQASTPVVNQPATEPTSTPLQTQAPTIQPEQKPISGFRQQSQDEQTLAKPKEQLPPLPPIMETQAVQNSPIMENLNMNAPQEDFTKSPFLNPNPNPAEVSGQNQAVNQPQKQKKKGKFLPVFLLLGIIIFFVIYTVVWAKLFNLF